MSMVKIIGVDFSGAQSDKNTWITEGWLNGSALHIERCRSIKRNVLTDFLKTLGSNAVAALDFPFGVPLDFANVLAPGARTMPEVWAAVADKEYNQVDKLRHSFVERHGEMIRRGDAHFGGPFSPLKAVNPDMLPMTFHGMRMLHKLRKAGFRVPPLKDNGCDGRSIDHLN